MLIARLERRRCIPSRWQEYVRRLAASNPGKCLFEAQLSVRWLSAQNRPFRRAKPPIALVNLMLI